MPSELAALDAEHPTEAQLRDACVVLAGQALTSADGDWNAAAAMLTDPLLAIGALDYPRGAVDGMKTCKGCGQAKPIGKDAGAFPQNRQTADGYGMYCHDCKDGQAES